MVSAQMNQWIPVIIPHIINIELSKLIFSLKEQCIEHFRQWGLRSEAEVVESKQGYKIGVHLGWPFLSINIQHWVSVKRDLDKCPALYKSRQMLFEDEKTIGHLKKIVATDKSAQ